jgi:ATP synthase I chain
MFAGLTELELPALTKVLRRTIWSSIIVGAAAVLVALLLAPPISAVGVVLGLGAAVVNLRFLDAGVAKVETKGETNNKVLRRLLATRTATRLAIMTAVVIGLMFLSPPLGIGVVAGLVIFQILFVINVARVVLAEGGLA